MRVSDDQLRFEETMRGKTPRQILANVRRIMPRNKQPNWVLAMDVFAVGGTFAHWICSEAGIDPDANKLTAFPAPPSPAKQAEEQTR